MRTSNISILLVEDSPTDAEIVRRSIDTVFPGGYVLKTVHTMADAERMLANASGAIDLILLDLGLPDTTSRSDTFIRMDTANTRGLPTIILSSIDDHSLAMGLVRHGAQDYVQKSVAGKLPNALRDAINFAIARHEKKQEQDKDAEGIRMQNEELLHYISGGYSVGRSGAVSTQKH